MTFPKLRATWVLGDELTASEMNTWDQNLSRALDGYGGGSYAPSTALTIGGSGVHGTGFFDLDNLNASVLSGRALNIESGADLVIASGGVLTAQPGSIAAIYGALNVYGATAFKVGSSLDIESGAYLDIHGTERVYGALQAIAGSVTTVAGTLPTTSTSTVTIGTSTIFNVNADIRREGADLPSGNGAYRALRDPHTPTAANTTFTPTRYDLIRVPNGWPANGVYTLEDAVRPCRLTFYSHGTSAIGHPVEVQDSAARVLATFSAGLGGPASAVLVWDGAAWFCESTQGNAA